MRHYRQGDVLVIRRQSLPPKVQKQDRPCILAYGEATGHSHQIHTGAELWVEPTEEGRRFLKVLDAVVEVRHEEHHPITLKQGIYEIIHQREYTPEAIRYVVD